MAASLLAAYPGTTHGMPNAEGSTSARHASA